MEKLNNVLDEAIGLNITIGQAVELCHVEGCIQVLEGLPLQTEKRLSRILNEIFSDKELVEP